MGALCSICSILTFAFENMAGDRVNLWRNRNSVGGSWGPNPWNPRWGETRTKWHCTDGASTPLNKKLSWTLFRLASHLFIFWLRSAFPSPCSACQQQQQSLCNSVWQVSTELARNPELSAEWWLHLQPVLLTPCLHQCGIRKISALLVYSEGSECWHCSGLWLTEYCFLKTIRTYYCPKWKVTKPDRNIKAQGFLWWMFYFSATKIQDEV